MAFCPDVVLPPNQCEKVKAKCSFSLVDRDLLKLKNSKKYIDVFLYPPLMI